MNKSQSSEQQKVEKKLLNQPTPEKFTLQKVMIDKNIKKPCK